MTLQRRTQLRQRGAKAERWSKWQEASERETRRRARLNGWRCEGCGKVAVSLEHHHLFSRGHLVAEPFASHPTLCRRLCRSGGGELGCHDKIHHGVDGKLGERLRHDAVKEFIAEFAPRWRPLRGSSPLETMRQLVDALVADGWRYDAVNNRISQGEEAA